MAMFKLECFTQAFAMIKFFSVFPRGINTETPPFAETNDAAKLLRINECRKFSNAPFCAGAEWRTMAHFWGGVFLNFSENDHLQPFFPTPFHKSGDNSPTSQGTTHCHVRFLYYLCIAIQNHRTLIALSSHYHRTHVHE